MTAATFSLLFTAYQANADHDGRTAGVCTRTAQVHDQIVAITSGVNNCADITAAHLLQIDRLDLVDNQSDPDNPVDRSLTSLKADDFAGLSNPRTLQLQGNGLTSLPAGVFDELRALENLNLSGNPLRELDADLFRGQRGENLQQLLLHDHPLSALPAGLFQGLRGLSTLSLGKHDPPGESPSLDLLLERIREVVDGVEIDAVTEGEDIPFRIHLAQHAPLNTSVDWVVMIAAGEALSAEFASAGRAVNWW